MNHSLKSQANNNLFLATIAFAVAFANWGLIAGIAPLLKQDLQLSGIQTSILIAIPVLLGSLGRIPIGIISDRLGGRKTFSYLLIFGFIPTIGLAIDHSYFSLLFWGLLLGLAGSSFVIGISFICCWLPPEKQGTALGIYGVGNMGQSTAVVFAPILVNHIGFGKTFLLFGLISLVWGLIFAKYASDAVLIKPSKNLKDNLKVLKDNKLSWGLSLFYSLSFGGFVTLSLYLPTLYQDMFAIDITTAGSLTALFVILATLCRPFGGWLSDRIGGKKLLQFVFVSLCLLGWIMTIPSFTMFNIGVFGSAIVFGLGNAAVFKLVPEYFPDDTGTVTGLVGGLGGLGGFVTPIELGLLKDYLGSYDLGFWMFSVFALLCLFVLRQIFMGVDQKIELNQN